MNPLISVHKLDERPSKDSVFHFDGLLCALTNLQANCRQNKVQELNLVNSFFRIWLKEYWDGINTFNQLLLQPQVKSPYSKLHKFTYENISLTRKQRWLSKIFINESYQFVLRSFLFENTKNYLCRKWCV